MNPSLDKLLPVSDGYIVYNVSGIRTHIVSRMDGKGYDITKRQFRFSAVLSILLTICTVGPHAVRTGQIVYVNDTSLALTPVKDKTAADQERMRKSRQPDIQLRLHIDFVDPMFQVQAGATESLSEAYVTAYTAFFGADLAVPPDPDQEPVRFGHHDGVRLTRDPNNPLGCSTYDVSFEGEALLVQRGVCTFLEKLLMAKAAGASGIVIAGDEELGINPSADAAEVAAAGNISDVALVALKRSAAQVVISMLDSVDAHGTGDVILMIDPEGYSGATLLPDDTIADPQPHSPIDPGRVLYVNGHPLLNTRLVV